MDFPEQVLILKQRRKKLRDRHTCCAQARWSGVAYSGMYYVDYFVLKGHLLGLTQPDSLAVYS